MTKFGKHPDKDTVDLAAEAAMGALADANVSMKDIGVLAAGNLMVMGGGIGQQLQKQIGQTGVPVPFVAGVIDCDGTSVRGNVVNVEPDADHVRTGMKVKLTTVPVGVDAAGTEAVGFGFEPREASRGQ